MSSISLENLMSRLPNERKAIKRLQSLINESAKDSAEKVGSEYTFEHLFQKAGFSSPEALALVLAELVERGAIEKKVRVESPTRGGGIGDFDSVLQVPEIIHDWRAEQDVNVTPDNLRVIFRLPQHAR